MDRHEKKPDDEECFLCRHEAHEDGRCYHCGIFSDDPVNPCTVNLGQPE